MPDLFTEWEKPPYWQPLAERLRPKALADLVGHVHLLGEEGVLTPYLQQSHLPSLLFWGPPGVGKTTLARCLAQSIQAHFLQLSAVAAGVKELKQCFDEAEALRMSFRQRTVLFIDEIHRFNKAQQDTVLPVVESGLIILIGATTENPGFAINNALLSRLQVYELAALDRQALRQIYAKMARLFAEEVGQPFPLTSTQQDYLLALADGDGRRLLGFCEIIWWQITCLGLVAITDAQLQQWCRQQPARFDQQGDHFYEQLSAFHKSVRGSSPDGALYWLARMLVAGCDPRVLLRRLTAIASEDIGNADPRALQLCLNAWDAFERLGPYEGQRAIAHAAVFCACAPKSNAIEIAFKRALQVAKATGSLPVPLHLQNAPTQVHQAKGCKIAYRYAHDEPQAYAAGQTYLPEGLLQQDFYQPTDRGLEQQIKAKLAQLAAWDKASAKKGL